MSDFIFSVNVTFPIFLVMVIGWVLHQIGMLDEHFVTVANRFNFKVTPVSYTHLTLPTN